MVTTSIAPSRLEQDIPHAVYELQVENEPQLLSLEEFLIAPVEGMEWVEGTLIEKLGMTLKHGLVQSRLDSGWRVYKQTSGQGGEVFTEAPCQTLNRGRRPDVAYADAEFLTQLGDAASAPQSFPLIAEIVSPTDEAEMVFAKAQEYLQSGCREVWLVMPENRYVFVITAEKRLWFGAGEVVSTQVVLAGFSVSMDELLG